MNWGINSLVRHICWQPMGVEWRIHSWFLGATSCLSPRTHFHCVIGQPASQTEKLKTVAAMGKREETSLAQTSPKSVSISQAVLATGNIL